MINVGLAQARPNYAVCGLHVIHMQHYTHLHMTVMGLLVDKVEYRFCTSCSSSSRLEPEGGTPESGHARKCNCLTV